MAVKGFKFILSLVTLTILKSTGEVLENIPVFNFFYIITVIKLGLWILGRKTIEVKSHFYHARAHIISMLTTVDFDLDYQWKLYFPVSPW